MGLSPKQLRYLWAVGYFKNRQGIKNAKRTPRKPMNIRPGHKIMEEVRHLLNGMADGDRAKLTNGEKTLVAHRKNDITYVKFADGSTPTADDAKDFDLLARAKGVRVSWEKGGHAYRTALELQRDRSSDLDALSKTGRVEDGLDLKQYRNAKFFDSPNSSDDWAAENVGEVFGAKSIFADRKDLREAVDDYRGTGFHAINMSLRARQPGDAVGQTVQKLDEAFSLARPVPEAITTYRGVRGEFSQRLKAAEEIGELTVGSILTDQGFMSTAMSRDVTNKFMIGEQRHIFEITVPKGTKALFLGKEYETELLLDRGSQIQVTHLDKDEYGRPVIRGILLPTTKKRA